MSRELDFLRSVRDGNYVYLNEVMEAIRIRIEYLDKQDVKGGKDE